MSQSLAGKTALVTGGSRGIGRAIAKRLAKEGAIVALTYNASKDGADETVASIEKSGGSAFPLHADLVDAKSIPDLFERLDGELAQRTGSTTLDVLVNNAGNSGWGGLAGATPDSWDEMFAVHARAPFFVVQSALSAFPTAHGSSTSPPPLARGRCRRCRSTPWPRRPSTT